MRMKFSGRRVSDILCLFLISQFSLGCGGQDGPLIAPVKGVVTANGKPVEGAIVNFTVKDYSRLSTGVTNDKGEYQLTTMNTNDGAVVGENQVAIRQAQKESAGMDLAMDPATMQQGKADLKGTPSKPVDLKKRQQNSYGVVPPKYGDPGNSGLKRSVVVGEKNIFNFDLKP